MLAQEIDENIRERHQVAKNRPRIVYKDGKKEIEHVPSPKPITTGNEPCREETTWYASTNLHYECISTGLPHAWTRIMAKKFKNGSILAVLMCKTCGEALQSDFEVMEDESGKRYVSRTTKQVHNQYV